jgi:hypothetical protein
LAALTRTHTIVILAAAFLMLLDGITAEELRASFRRFPARFLPIVLTPVAFLTVSTVTGDQDTGERIFLPMLRAFGSLHLFAQNGLAFLADWLLVIPLTIPWLAMRFSRIPGWLPLFGLIGASVLSYRVGWVAFAAGASCVALADILWDAIERRDRVQLALWVWLLLAMPVIIYVHLPSKYLLPSVPAAAILVVRAMPEAQRAVTRWLMPAVVAAGVVLGLLILIGIRDLAETQRRAVVELIDPQIKTGEQVWFAGHWGFQWYAEKAGAKAVTLEPPLPQFGDVIVVSEIDFPFFEQRWTRKRVQKRLCYASTPWGRVMDFEGHAGFFSSPFGYLPWVWGSGEASCFEVWKVE